MKRHKLKTLHLCLSAASLFGASAGWATSYNYTPINGPGNVPASAGAVNDSGQIPITYRSGGIYQSFIYAGGNYTRIDDPVSADGTFAESISNSGLVVGSYDDANGRSHGFIYNGSTYTTLDRPGAYHTDLRSINSNGDIVGTYSTVSNPGPYDDIYFLYSKGVFTDFHIPGAKYTEASSINDLGQISGAYEDPSGPQPIHGFIWSANQPLTILDYPGAPSGAMFTSTTGQTVGIYDRGAKPSNSYEYKNGVYSAISTPYDATDYIDVLGVNKNGWISGTRYPNRQGSGYGYLLTPVPEPSRSTLLLMGLIGLAGWRLKRRGLRPGGWGAAGALAMGLIAPPSFADPVVAHWTLVDLGTLGGSRSSGFGINNAGQVTGSSRNADEFTGAGFLYSNGQMTGLGTLGGSFSTGWAINDAGQIAGDSWTPNPGGAFLYSKGVMNDLGTLGGTRSAAYGINAAGLVVGDSYTKNSYTHAFLYSNGKMNDLGTLGGSDSTARSINNTGQVVGYSSILDPRTNHAFLYSNGVMKDLSTLGGTNSYGYAINNSGQVTGLSDMSGDAASHAFLYSNGAMADLGSLGGIDSSGYGINNTGQVTGYSYIAGNIARHAFLYSDGKMTDLNTLNGVSGGSVILAEGRGINDAGQIVANSDSRAYLLTLDTTVWEGGSWGSFASGSGWSAGIAPNRNTRVFIDPTVSATIYGPSVSTDMRQLTIGGDATGNNGVATLALNGGTINVTGVAGQFTIITAKGVLTGDGRINGAVVNQGTVNAVNLTLVGGLVNTGTVTGNGTLNTSLTNAAGGVVRAGAGQVLSLSGAAHSNVGSVELLNGGELRVQGGFSNAAGGRVILNNGTARFADGLANAGQLQVTFGGGSVFGAVSTTQGGKIILSGNSNTTFYDPVEIQTGGELRTAAGSTAVFFGQVSQRTGSMFTGVGTKFYEGGLHVGASPGLGVDAGDVNFGSANVFSLDIGGTTACTAACATDVALKNSSYGRYVVNGRLSLGGTLKLGSWMGFVAQAGESFSLLSWGSVSGSFDSIDTSGLMLAQGTALDASRLAIDGSVRVVAVPEPASWAMWLAGMAGLAVGRGRLRHRSVSATAGASR